MKGASVDTWVLIVGSMAFTMMMVVMGYLYIMGVAQGSCWSGAFETLTSFQSKVHKLKVGESTNIFVAFGSCVNFVLLENREDFGKAIDLVNSASNSEDTQFDCPKKTDNGDEIKTVLAAVKQSEAEYSWTDVSKDPENREKLATYLRSFAGLGKATHCIFLKCPNCTVSGKINLPINGMEKKYCIQITKASEFVYSIDNQLLLGGNARLEDCEEPVNLA